MKEGASQDLDLKAIVKDLHGRVKRQREGNSAPGMQNGFDAWPTNLATVRQACKYLYEIRASVGKMPPNPGTLRARLSARVISLFRRALFWYTPSIVEFNSAAVSVFDRLCSLHEMEYRYLRKLSEDLEGLRLGVRQAGMGRSSSAPPAPEPLPSTKNSIDADLTSFYFALQERFRGAEAEVGLKLDRYLHEIRTARPKLPSAPWVDLGCGRGEWLALASAAGHDVTGVDRSAEAVRHCHLKGLQAENWDALRYLRSLGVETLSVITAFHFLEHCPFEIVFELVREAARTLKPGGLLVIEVPNPANLLAGGCEFWRDPTHIRPLPADLLIFLLEYHGFKVARILYQNAAAEEDRLPFAELEFVDRLNGVLYGPRDYGLVARL